MIEPAAGSKDVVSFGPFSLDPRRRLLLKDGAPVVLGARTLDTLIALVARPNEAISKRELMAVVWRPTSPSRRAAYALRSPPCARRWGTARVAHATS
jgi:DNA-binding winged helix-turn-helix (wHTH) protein